MAVVAVHEHVPATGAGSVDEAHGGGKVVAQGRRGQVGERHAPVAQQRREDVLQFRRRVEHVRHVVATQQAQVSRELSRACKRDSIIIKYNNNNDFHFI